MKIKRILTNNAVVIEDKKGIEKIVCGKGIAYKKRIGDDLQEEKINQVFYLERNDLNLKFQELFTEIPIEVVEVCKEAIDLIYASYSGKISESIYISLLDHVYVALQRYEKNIFLKNEFLVYLQAFHEEEYLAGRKVVDLLNKRFGISFDENEVGFITLHIIDCSLNKSQEKQSAIKIATIIDDILNVIKNFYNKEFDTNSVYYMKFMTHLRFLAKKIVCREELDSEDYINDEGAMLSVLRKKYKKAFECSVIISKIVKQKYTYEINDEDQIFLIIHIERLIVKLG